MKKLLTFFDFDKKKLDWSNLLLRIPLAAVFLQQGLNKLPFSTDAALAFGLSPLVWWFVIVGEICSGIGLLVGSSSYLIDFKNIHFLHTTFDFLTRFSGIVMCCIATGVIWITNPESLWSVVWNDHLHVFLWVGGLYFALRGNWAVMIDKRSW